MFKFFGLPLDVANLGKSPLLLVIKYKNSEQNCINLGNIKINGVPTWKLKIKAVIAVSYSSSVLVSKRSAEVSANFGATRIIYARVTTNRNCTSCLVSRYALMKVGLFRYLGCTIDWGETLSKCWSWNFYAGTRIRFRLRPNVISIYYQQRVMKIYFANFIFR